MQQNSDAWLKRIPDRVGNYLAGFADGEGSFNASLRRRDDHSTSWQVTLTFNVAQRDRTVIALFKRYLGCGRIQERSDGVHYFVVASYRSIGERVIPFFNRFVFLSASKKHNFSVFCKIARIMEEQRHLTKEGMDDVVALREQLNPGRGRTRKYAIRDYQQIPRRNPQRLYARRSSKYQGE